LNNEGAACFVLLSKYDEDEQGKVVEVDRGCVPARHWRYEYRFFDGNV
jgi:hypothetical protein